MLTLIIAALLPTIKPAGHCLLVLALSCGDDLDADERALYDYTPPRDLGTEPWRDGALS